MKLTISTDYSLRVLLYLALEDERFVPASEIAERFDVSAHHVSKVAKALTSRGWLEGRRGNGGGVRLAVDPRKLSVGKVVAELEDLQLLECFSTETDGCLISPGCQLKRALRQATATFVKTLDEYTLADLTQGKRLRSLLGL